MGKKTKQPNAFSLETFWGEKERKRCFFESKIPSWQASGHKKLIGAAVFNHLHYLFQSY